MTTKTNVTRKIGKLPCFVVPSVALDSPKLNEDALRLQELWLSIRYGVHPVAALTLVVPLAPNLVATGGHQ